MLGSTRWGAAALGLVAALACAPTVRAQSVASPDGRTVVTLALDGGRLTWQLSHRGRRLFRPSGMGFAFRGAPPLQDSLRVVDSARATHDETWTQPWGEVARVREHYNELAVTVQETRAPARRFTVRVRAFDDGAGFRYEVPDQPGLGDYEMTDELTDFTLADNAHAWWLPSNRPRLDRSEELWENSPVSTVDSIETPLTLKFTDGTWAVIHEADLEDYAKLNLANPRGMESLTLHAALQPWFDGVKVRGHTPFQTPWRTIQLADRIEDLAPSVLGLNLNPPNRLADVSWIHPMKYVGIWWGMHINVWTWSTGAHHGATTERARQYIDFAAANGFGGVLVEGWNTGWDGDWIQNRNAFSFTRSNPDYDLAEVARYARSKGVALIVHNETSGGIVNYERQLDSAYSLYQSLGVHAIKTGYVTDTAAGGNSHWGQRMVNHYRRVIETAARYQIAVDAHEPIQSTGEQRTWPNMMAREGSRGQEYNAWGGEGGNPPEHETNIFFTRDLDGPNDFTPGIFDLTVKSGGHERSPEESRPRTTLAKQLALYVVIYSPLQMAADLIENYQGQPAFQFIRDVAVDWDTTIVLKGMIGDYVIVARKQRGDPQWFIGAITDEEARTFDVPLSFLTPGRRYVADVYADGPGADWRDNPTSIAITHRLVTSRSSLHIARAPGGGQAIRIHPAGER